MIWIRYYKGRLFWIANRILKIQNCGPKDDMFEPNRSNLRLIGGEWIGAKMNHYLSEFIMGYADLTYIVNGERVWIHPDEGIQWQNGLRSTRLECVRCGRGLTDAEVKVTYVSEYYNVRTFGKAKCVNCGTKFRWDYTGTC